MGNEGHKINPQDSRHHMYPVGALEIKVFRKELDNIFFTKHLKSLLSLFINLLLIPLQHYHLVVAPSAYNSWSTFITEYLDPVCWFQKQIYSCYATIGSWLIKSNKGFEHWKFYHLVYEETRDKIQSIRMLSMVGHEGDKTINLLIIRVWEETIKRCIWILRKHISLCRASKKVD